MNDFSELENELRKLRPARASSALEERIGTALAREANENKIVRPSRFRVNWLGLGIGLAAAATFLIFSYLDRKPAATPKAVATSSPTVPAPRIQSPNFQPAGLTQVVYHTQDEGIFFPRGESEPVRRVRTAKRETLQWRDAQTGASLRVSYPAEEVSFVPLSGQ